MTATMTAPGLTACSPRFATPRDSGRETFGPAVGEVSRRLRRPLMPWQQQVIDVALELDPDGSYHYDEVVLTVPRQSGKTALVLAVAVHRLVVVPRTLGRQRLTYTAQQRQKARLKLERDFAEILREAAPSFKEITHIRARPQRASEWKMSLNNGAENIQFGKGNYLQIDAPSRTGGHGDTLDVGVIDEAFAHQDDTIEAGMEPSMITRANHQLVVLSTAGDAQSKYLWRKTLAGRNACERGEHGRTAYFEWSAPDDADPADPETWAGCSPALGRTITLRALEGQWEKAVRNGQEGIDKFRRSYLNQWPDIPILSEAGSAGWSVISEDSWSACLNELAGPSGVLAWAVDCAPDGRSAAVSCSNGSYVEVVDHRPGTSWAPARLVELRAAHGFDEVALDATGPAGALIPALEDLGVPWRKVTLQEHAQACGGLLEAVTDKVLVHRGQPVLDAAVEGAARRSVSDVWLWTRSKSSSDISPLVSATLARWLASQADGGSINLW